MITKVNRTRTCSSAFLDTLPRRWELGRAAPYCMLSGLCDDPHSRLQILKEREAYECSACRSSSGDAKKKTTATKTLTMVDVPRVVIFLLKRFAPRITTDGEAYIIKDEHPVDIPLTLTLPVLRVSECRYPESTLQTHYPSPSSGRRCSRAGNGDRHRDSFRSGAPYRSEPTFRALHGDRKG